MQVIRTFVTAIKGFIHCGRVDMMHSRGSAPTPWPTTRQGCIDKICVPYQINTLMVCKMHERVNG